MGNTAVWGGKRGRRGRVRMGAEARAHAGEQDPDSGAGEVLISLCFFGGIMA